MRLPRQLPGTARACVGLWLLHPLCEKNYKMSTLTGKKHDSLGIFLFFPVVSVCFGILDLNSDLK